MVRTFSSYKNHFTKITKSWKKENPSCLELHEYPLNRNLRVVICTEEYLKTCAQSFEAS